MQVGGIFCLVNVVILARIWLLAQLYVTFLYLYPHYFSFIVT